MPEPPWRSNAAASSFVTFVSFCSVCFEQKETKVTKGGAGDDKLTQTREGWMILFDAGLRAHAEGV